jgi:YfiH family protein
MSWMLEEISGLSCFRSPLLSAYPEVAHGFFSRRGGVSPGPFDSLNLSFAVGDLRELVIQNRALVQQSLGLKALAGATQVHGCRESVVAPGNAAPDAEIEDADILITPEPGLGLLIKQADCQAVMLHDPARRVIANVHAGWRGQVKNILGAAVRLLQEKFGSRPGDLAAALGPSLGPCCAEFRNYQREFPPELWPYRHRADYFDLWSLSRDQLLAAGLDPRQIDIAGICTRCRADLFFSYRREGRTGRQGAVIALRR